MTENIQKRRAAGVSTRPAAIGVFVIALGLYTATLAPGLLWGGGDFARFQTWAYLGRIEGGVDVFAHPLWVYLVQPVMGLPVRDPAWRANFASALFAAGALVFVFLAAARLTRSGVAALLGTGALLVSHTFWTYAVMPKVYSLDALFLAACAYLLLRWRDEGRDRYLALAGSLYGLSFLNHLVMVTAALGFWVFVAGVLWRGRHGRAVAPRLLLVATAFGLGLAPYGFLVLGTGASAATAATAVAYLKGTLYTAAHPDALAKGIGLGCALAIYQFPLTFFIGLLGLYRLWRRDRGGAMLIGLCVLGTFAFLLAALEPAAGGVYVWNLHYYLQAYVPFALAIAAGFDALWGRTERRRGAGFAALVGATLLLPVVLYAIAPSAARRVLGDVPDFRALPGRDNFRYVLSPWKQEETGARDLGERMLGALPPDSVIFADYSLWAVLNYLQVVEGARPDVQLVLLPVAGDQTARVLERRAAPRLFLADRNRYYDVQGFERYFQIVPDGPVYRLLPRT